MTSMPLNNRTHSRKRVLQTAVAALLAAVPTAFAADTWPGRPIKLIVPFAPGGPIDVMGRVLAKILGEKIGQTVVVEKRPGLGGNLSTDQAVKAALDGYTLAPLIALEFWKVIADIRASGIARLIVDRDYRKVLAHSDQALVLQKGQVERSGEAVQVAGDAALTRPLGV